MTDPSLKVAASHPAAEGDVAVADVVIAKLAGHAARLTYGVVGMHRSLVSPLTHLFRHSLTDGIEVEVREGAAQISLNVVMERGVNLAQVTANLQNQVRYEVESLSGVRVRDVNVRVEEVRE